jgi:hypothetical protein
MMTETISPPESQPAESPHLPRPETDSAALRAIDEATEHVGERALKIRQNPEQHKPNMPGRQHEIQDCVNKILVKVDSEPAAS